MKREREKELLEKELMYEALKFNGVETWEGYPKAYSQFEHYMDLEKLRHKRRDKGEN